jgi:hypothetical protein
VVAEEHRPLAILGNVRRLAQDLDDRMPILLPHRHEHARHEREVERHVTLVTVAEIRAHVGRPLVGLGEQHAIRVAAVERAANLLQDLVRFLEVFADRALALDQIRDGVEPQSVDAAIEPELHDPDHRLEHRRIVEVEVRLMMEEPMPIVGLGRVVPAPVRGLGVGEDDADALVLPVGLAPDVEVPRPGSRRCTSRGLEPGMLIRRVVDDQLGDHPDIPPMCLRQEPIEVVQRAVDGMDVLVIRDVIPVVPKRRRVEGKQPEDVDAESLQVIEFLGEAGEVADAVVVAVEEGAHVRLIDDGVFVPEGIGGERHLQPRSGRGESSCGGNFATCT